MIIEQQPALVPNIPSQAALDAWRQAGEQDRKNVTEPQRFYEALRDRYSQEEVVLGLQAVLQKRGAEDHQTYALPLPRGVVLTADGFVARRTSETSSTLRPGEVCINGWEPLSAAAFQPLESAEATCAALDAALTEAAAKPLPTVLLGASARKERLLDGLSRGCEIGVQIMCCPCICWEETC